MATPRALPYHYGVIWTSTKRCGANSGGWTCSGQEQHSTPGEDTRAGGAGVSGGAVRATAALLVELQGSAR
jgi:hypothetical protein